MPSAADLITSLTATVPDFPKPGILFRDLTPVFANGEALRVVTDALVEPFRGEVDAVAGVEARGFVLAAAAAYALGVGMLIIRKPGKLPRPHLSQSYDLEYGSATLELQPDDLPPASRVLVLDDLLATGGTLSAAIDLVQRANWTVAGVSVVLELEGLGGRAVLAGHTVRSLVTL
ncbi:adenine phosphoribosyltransferase [Galbitalea soli]|uniref:Adenine phosphoribosyltransferase n=1 Tax=Galbitalea soli TaxID=1268042 RepID=A0A7C9TPD4_9MICO|nr:adenine phosphoribosyltransferase [Galbitalea soli]NEM90677.1 adenine phosphoribosyltransferase [Galbitalea soli]NYJ31395.1 adenine phosphoribosyltransferase [Galbitalea soli]